MPGSIIQNTFVYDHTTKLREVMESGDIIVDGENRYYFKMIKIVMIQLIFLIF